MSLRQASASISSLLPPTGGQDSEQRHFNVRQRGRILWDMPYCMIITMHAMKSKSKKQFQHGVRIGFSLQQDDMDTDRYWRSGYCSVPSGQRHPFSHLPGVLLVDSSQLTHTWELTPQGISHPISGLRWNAKGWALCLDSGQLEALS